ncbi:MAG: hypothetical protein V4460_09095 [Pseudomonadota bacterium]|jgi:hypothetical protein
MMSLRPDFERALRFFGRVGLGFRAKGYDPPVLVGGAAVELFSNNLIATGDFDISTPRQDAFERELVALGFTKPAGKGMATRGWIHQDFKLGFEVVSSTLLDGMADRERLVLIDLGEDGIAAILSIEDTIADRMGQFHSGSAPEMLQQARVLASLHKDVDVTYLDRRIREETGGDLGVEDIPTDTA